jgi:H+/Cl- antiporter ClcA
MFGGKFEFQAIATMNPMSHEMDSGLKALIVAVTKLVATSFTGYGEYRGGSIFPAIAASAALSQTIQCILPITPVQLCCLCLAGLITVAITQMAVATTLILDLSFGGSKYKFGDSRELIEKLLCDLVHASHEHPNDAFRH